MASGRFTISVADTTTGNIMEAWDGIMVSEWMQAKKKNKKRKRPPTDIDDELNWTAKKQKAFDADEKMKFPHTLNARLKKIERPQHNPLEKLPGEIKNRIYSFALGLPVKLVVHAKRATGTLTASREPEPSLLLVSKTLRSEAGSMYYRDVEIRFKSGEWKEACSWLGTKLETCVPADKCQFVLRMDQAVWRDIDGWLQLAKLVHKTDLGLSDHAALVSVWEKSVLTPGRCELSLHQTDNLQEGLRMTIDFALQARADGSTDRELEIIFYQRVAGWISKSNRGRTRKDAANSLYEALMKTSRGQRYAVGDEIVKMLADKGNATARREYQERMVELGI